MKLHHNHIARINGILSFNLGFLQ